ncbi:MAG: hypothetical protein WA323_15535 [Candidatus Nitrosopolaris sp.]
MTYVAVDVDVIYQHELLYQYKKGSGFISLVANGFTAGVDHCCLTD